MDIGIMIEGQNGLNWPRWQRIVRAADDLGFQCVFRSDHYTNAGPPDLDSLELWTSLTYAAGNTQRIEFGPLVTPVTFRHPTITARVAAAVDDLSGGRLVLGMGAGWQDREHHNFGIPFPPTPTRHAMLDEYVRVVQTLLRSDQPSHFSGQHYTLDDAILLPRPQRPGGPRILIGGNGKTRTLPIAARYADEWNAIFLTPDAFRALSAHLDSLLDKAGRPWAAVKRSMMVGTRFTRSEDELQKLLDERGMTADELRQRGLVMGTSAMWVEQLSAYAAAGLQRIMLQWLDLDDIDGLEIVARDVLPNVRTGAAAG
jgi:F420-dependent oxidoreductase-like protein